jgi:hypothetical protein
MFVLATVTFTDPSKLAPYFDEEVAEIHANHDKGLIVSQYLRADGKGRLSSGRLEASTRRASAPASSRSRRRAS